MFGIADYWAFVVAIIVFLAIPGVGNLAIITSTTKGRIAGGLAATLGVIVGDQVLMWLAVAGVAAVLTANPALFGVVQYAGAIYLAYLGIRMALARPGDAPVLNMQPRRFFQQAMLITLLNPKAIVFYMAFFPLFVDPARHQGAADLRRHGGDHRGADLPLLRDRHLHHALRRRPHARQPARLGLAQPDRRDDAGRLRREARHRQVSRHHFFFSFSPPSSGTPLASPSRPASP